MSAASKKGKTKTKGKRKAEADDHEVEKSKGKKAKTKGKSKSEVQVEEKKVEPSFQFKGKSNANILAELKEIDRECPLQRFDQVILSDRARVSEYRQEVLTARVLSVLNIYPCRDYPVAMWNVEVLVPENGMKFQLPMINFRLVAKHNDFEKYSACMLG